MKARRPEAQPHTDSLAAVGRDLKRYVLTLGGLVLLLWVIEVADLLLLGGYLVIRNPGNLLICDANAGGVLASYNLYGLERKLFDDQLALVAGRLHAKDLHGGLYVLELPRGTPPSTAPAPLRGF